MCSYRWTNPNSQVPTYLLRYLVHVFSRLDLGTALEEGESLSLTFPPGLTFIVPSVGAREGRWLQPVRVVLGQLRSSLGACLRGSFRVSTDQVTTWACRTRYGTHN